MKNKTLFIIPLIFILLFQTITPAFANAQSKEAEIVIKSETLIIPEEPFLVEVTYQNEPRYSGNKQLSVEFLLNEKVIATHEMDRLKPNDKIEFNKELSIEDWGTSTLKARVVWNKSKKKDNAIFVAESNSIELITDPNIKPDADKDGLPDEKEIEIGTDPNKEDSDNDGLNDLLELNHTGTNPLNSDTDEDGTTDGLEDSDKDGLINIEEVRLKTDPGKNDTDEDGLDDGEEVNKYHTDPNKMDTDGDSLLDGSDVNLGFDPLKQDTDSDGVIDSEEVIKQELNKNAFEHLSLDGLIPSITFDSKGDINRNIAIQDASNHVFLKSNRSIVGKPINVDVLNQFESATVTFKIEANVLEKHDLENLRIGSFNEDETKFIELETNIDPKNNILTATVPHFSPVFVYDKEIYDYDIVADNPESSIEKGPSDIVFVIDSTGSMGSSIANVKNNIHTFVNKLAEKKVDVRLGLVEFKDITVDGEDSTKNYGWFTDVNQFKDKVSSIRATGGGDTPETAVDALEEARRLEFRANVGKYIVLLTDANYKENTRFPEVTSMYEEIKLLQEDGIVTSVIGNSYYRSFYDELYRTTDGIWASLYGNFSSNLVPLIDKIEEDVGSYVWIRLSSGEVVKLDKEPDKDDLVTDSDGDTIPDSVELDKEWINMDGLRFWEFHSNPAKKDTDGDSYIDTEDRYPKQPYSPSIVFVHGRIDNTSGPIRCC